MSFLPGLLFQVKLNESSVLKGVKNKKNKKTRGKQKLNNSTFYSPSLKQITDSWHALCK